ncbi:hypothetical protein SAMN05192588_2510 [Nonlabens sp. Hel1_33_55]|uniref:hypothetical protein n=1 Tax=Nonlabens sp. Hel1_33_55 TaxID=1336802 RepID=UPI000875AA8E|nr:hypothetical protein [Nonlabens sp. Hel1_33_55]SCY36686.1 hypothetical protein SAMN05192588_2510 [Nonlabens sp. Hel1_33_55]
MTNSQKHLVGEILLQMINVHSAKNSEELRTIGQLVYNVAYQVEPLMIEGIDGLRVADHRGKDLLMSILANDINDLGKEVYPTLKDEKFMMLTSLRILIGAFVLMSEQDLKVIKKTLG